MKVLNSLKGDQCDHFYSIFKKMPPKEPAQDSKPSKEKGSTPSTEVSPKNDKNSSSGQIQGRNEVSPPAPTSPPASTKEDLKPSKSEMIHGLNEESPLAFAPAKEDQKPSLSEQLHGLNEVSPLAFAPAKEDQKPSLSVQLHGLNEVSLHDEASKGLKKASIKARKGQHLGKAREA